MKIKNVEIVYKLIIKSFSLGNLSFTGKFFRNGKK